MTTENKNEHTMKPDASTKPAEDKAGANKPGDSKPGQGMSGDKRPGQQQGQQQGQKPATTKP